MVRKKKISSSSNGDPRRLMIVHSKRKEIVDADGWTHIMNKPQKGSSCTNSKKALRPLLYGGDFEIRGIPYLNQSAHELQNEFTFFQKQWEDSDACIELKKNILMAGEKRKKFEVKNVVVLGLGSLSSARRDGRRTSATQLAAVLTILKIFGRETPVFVQDPQYIDTDNQFLQSLGWIVLNDPKAFEIIDDSSLVFAVHCYRGVYDAIANCDTKPAMLIGTNMDIFWRFDSSVETGGSRKKLEEMIMGCEEISFPQLRHDFSDTKIYWRER